MSRHYDPTADGMMRMPSPMDERSGWVDPYSNPNYAQGSAPGPAPDGKVFVPEMNTYVDTDIAEQLGLLAPQGTSGSPQASATVAAHATALDPRALQAGHDPLEDIDIEELSDGELEALQQQLEIKDTNEAPSLSDTLDNIAECFTPDAFVDGIEAMVETGDFNDTLTRLSQATGMDATTASMLVETTVMEASPVASEYIGGDRWSSLVHAASGTDDSFARRIVSDVVTGRLDPAQLPNAYSLWWQSLPDADEG